MENTLMKLALSKDRPVAGYTKIDVNMNEICSAGPTLEPGQKLCKECGLPFTPKGREGYCTREHYRPCPVCQKPVLIKYLSDPTPCCSKECTKAKRSGSKKMLAPSATSTPEHNFTDFQQGEKRMYIGSEGVVGLHNGHIYTIEIDRDPVYHNYQITATYDHTEDKACEHMMTCCSMLNINNNVFVRLDKDTTQNSEENND